MCQREPIFTKQFRNTELEYSRLVNGVILELIAFYSECIQHSLNKF